jgi:hypothetical protein
MAEVEIETEEFKGEFLRELKGLQDSGFAIPFELSAGEAWYLFSALQLVLRHPSLQNGRGQDQLSGWLHAFAREIQRRLCTTPTMQRVAEMGWDARHDIG